jgi:hypothetical protein
VFRGLPATRLGLDVEDLYGTDEPIAVRVRSEDERAELILSVADEHGSEVARTALPSSLDAWREAELPPLPEGAYRIAVGGGPLVQPVTDRFVVYGPDAA